MYRTDKQPAVAVVIVGICGTLALLEKGRAMRMIDRDTATTMASRFIYLTNEGLLQGCDRMFRALISLIGHLPALAGKGRHCFQPERDSSRRWDKPWTVMRHIIFALALVAGLAAPAWADSAKAVQTLAEQGDAKAQFALGTMYRDGRGVAQDYDEALRWWRKAAESGLVDAQFALGNIYAGDAGIARNNILAYMWYSIATAQSGDEWLRAIAGSNRDVLAARMTPAEIFESQRLVTEWVAKHGKK